LETGSRAQMGVVSLVQGRVGGGRGAVQCSAKVSAAQRGGGGGLTSNPLNASCQRGWWRLHSVSKLLRRDRQKQDGGRKNVLSTASKA
jgi:hypothetical protein